MAAERFWGRLDRWVERAEGALLTGLLLALIGIGCAQVLLRNLAAGGMAWGDPLLRVLVLWVGLLGAVAASRQRRHISIDLLSRFLAAGVARWVGRLTDGFTAGVSALLAVHAGRLVLLEQQTGTVAFGGLPVWCLQLILPIGFGLIALRYGIGLIVGSQRVAVRRR